MQFHFTQLRGIRRACTFLAAAACFAAAPVLAASEIVLGQIGPFTVLPVPDAPQVNQGIRAYAVQANKTGIRGRKIRIFELDDRYSPEGFLEQFGKALENKPLALLSPIGSNSLSRAMSDKILDSSDVLVMNAIPGAESLRNPGHPKLFHIRAGDKQQIEKIVKHARTLGISRMSVLYRDIVIGTSGMDVAQKEASSSPGLVLKGVKSGMDAPALEAASQQLAAQQPQGVLVVGAPRFMADGVAALRKAHVTQPLFVLSYVPAGLIVKLAGVQGARGVGIAQTFPDPNGHTLPLQRDFQSAMKAAFPDLKDYTSFHLEGYLSARTVGEAVKRDKEKEPTATSLAATLRSMGEIDFGGFRVDFSKGNVGSTFVDIAVIGGDGRLRY